MPQLRKCIYFVLIMLITIAPASARESRSELNLNQGWFFFNDRDNMEIAPEEDLKWEQIDLPHTWNNKDVQSGRKVNYGTSWYKRALPEADGLDGSRAFLKFNGVGQYAAIYVNGKFAGEHLGSYSAFSIDVTRFLKASGNELKVKVNNEIQLSYPRNNFLFGIFGGIYRDVSLIVTQPVHFSLDDVGSNGLYIQQRNVSAKHADITSTTVLSNSTDFPAHAVLQIRLLDKAGREVAQKSERLTVNPGGDQRFSTDLSVSQPRLWNGIPDPYLYTIEATLLVDGEPVDQIRDRIGFRSFEIDHEKGFILNGKPYRLYGVNRHQEWQDLGNALTRKEHKADMDMIAEMGATSIRLAHYQQDQYMYDLADEMGFLIWAEIPFVHGYHPGADGNALQQLEELIKQSYNHPSIFVWGLHNEVVEGRKHEMMPQVNLTKRLHLLAKQLDPDRLTVTVGNRITSYDIPIHNAADLQGFNNYQGWYGSKVEALDGWLKTTHSQKPHMKISISEYGAGGNPAQQSRDDITQPPALGQFFPEGYQTRYHEVAWTTIEKHPAIWGSYVWNMFDFAVPMWNRGGIAGRNHKGLVSYDRKARKDAFYWYKANWSKEPVLHLVGKRNVRAPVGTLTIKAYSNIGAPTLRLNGATVGEMGPGINSKQFLMEVDLVQGDNRLEITADSNGTALSDTYTINAQPNYSELPR